MNFFLKKKKIKKIFIIANKVWALNNLYKNNLNYNLYKVILILIIRLDYKI